MLIEFCVENFLSIREKVVFSMGAVKSDKQYIDNTLLANPMPSNMPRLLSTAVIYGANASGKSNIINSFNFLENLVRNSHKKKRGDLLNRVIFKLDETYKDRPSVFEVSFIHNDIRYFYYVELDDEQILEEHLFCWKNLEKKKNQRYILFERSLDKGMQVKTKTKKDLDFVINQTLENNLLLSCCKKFGENTFENQEEIENAYEWFQTFLQFYNDPIGLSLVFSIKFLKEHEEERRNTLLEAMQYADFGIKGIDVETEKIPTEGLKGSEDSINSFLNNQKKQGMYTVVQKGLALEVELNQVKTKKQCYLADGEVLDISFDIDEESSGTRKYFGVMGPIIDVLENGRTLIIDELGACLHPLLLQKIIELFHNPEINKKQAQLIFTTHNTDILSMVDFRRDQIWFTDKHNKYSETTLESMACYDVRNDVVKSKSYLLGKFGAIPNINELFSYE